MAVEPDEARALATRRSEPLALDVADFDDSQKGRRVGAPSLAHPGALRTPRMPLGLITVSGTRESAHGFGGAIESPGKSQ
jgi:hypothetical protein